MIETGEAGLTTAGRSPAWECRYFSGDEVRGPDQIVKGPDDSRDRQAGRESHRRGVFRVVQDAVGILRSEQTVRCCFDYGRYAGGVGCQARANILLATDPVGCERWCRSRPVASEFDDSDWRGNDAHLRALDHISKCPPMRCKSGGSYRVDRSGSQTWWDQTHPNGL